MKAENEGYEESVNRIRVMGVYLTKATELLGRSSLDLGERNALSLYISELDDYYTSENWKLDLNLDELGKLPDDLKRGVLSEDGIFNLLERYKERFEEDGSRKMKQYIVDAFTDKPFSGNPAAVCVMESWPSEKFMKDLAMENNLSETAYIVKEEQGYHLRWFTPGSEVELCGHATLASAFVILNFIEPDKDIVKFNTLSGELKVTRHDNLLTMDFPTYEQKEIPVTDDMESAFGVHPVKAVLGPDLVCVFDSEEKIRSMNPDQQKLAALPGRGQNVTALGKESDCVSRSFFPKLLVAEDPVCGSAHCQIASYWAKELNKTKIHAYQASRRGGHLYCEILDNARIAISGKAALVAVSDIVV